MLMGIVFLRPTVRMSDVGPGSVFLMLKIQLNYPAFRQTIYLDLNRAFAQVVHLPRPPPQHT